MGSGKCKCWDCVGSRDRRQQVRHGGVTEEELPRGPKKKKNTKKWCKGKEGVKHEYVRGYPYNWTTRIEAEICANCGKHGKFFYENYWD